MALEANDGIANTLCTCLVAADGMNLEKIQRPAVGTAAQQRELRALDTLQQTLCIAKLHIVHVPMIISIPPCVNNICCAEMNTLAGTQKRHAPCNAFTLSPCDPFSSATLRRGVDDLLGTS